MKTLTFLVVMLCAFAGAAQENPYPGRTGLAFPEGFPQAVAVCDDLAATIRGLRILDSERVDLWASGPATIVQTDRVLWYIGTCHQPGIRVLCVTYSDNDIRIGNAVTVRGAMRIQDSTHILLDPCLTSRDQDSLASVLIQRVRYLIRAKDGSLVGNLPPTRKREELIGLLRGCLGLRRDLQKYHRAGSAPGGRRYVRFTPVGFPPGNSWRG